MTDRAEIIAGLLDTMQSLKRVMGNQYLDLLKDADLSRTQLELMLVIRHKQPITTKELAQRLHLTPGAVSQMVDILARAELLERQPDANDRRIIHLMVSAKGIKVLARVETQLQQHVTEAMQDLRTEELQSWLTVQQKILARFEKQATTNPKGNA